MRLDGQKVGQLRFAATTEESRLFSPDVRLDLAAHFASIIERILSPLAF